MKLAMLCTTVKKDHDTYKLVRQEHGHEDVCRIVGDEEESGLAQQRLVLVNVLINLSLALKVRHREFAAGDLLIIRESTPDVVLKGGGLGGGLCAVDSLGRLNGNRFFNVVGSERRKEIGDNKDGMRFLFWLA